MPVRRGEIVRRPVIKVAAVTTVVKTNNKDSK